MKPLLSIIVPSYQRRKYLAECLAALESQPHSRVEVIVVLDPSGDGSEKLLQPKPCRGVTPEGIIYWNEHFEVVPIINQQRIGFAGSFNLGVQKATGEYCWLLGDDDILESGAVERLVNALEVYQPGLLIALDGAQDWAGAPFSRHETFRDWCKACMATMPKLLCEDTTLSARVFRRDLYDFATALQFLDTHYGHIYASTQADASVYLLRQPLYRLRPQNERPLWSEFPPDLEAAVSTYLKWLSVKVGVDCDPNIVLEDNRKRFKKSASHPLSFLYHRRRALFRLDAWRYLFNRLVKI
jgi:glycosyltransferase involved in cell wall biosynthesis